MVAGDHSQSADVEGGTPHEEVGLEEVGGHHDAWVDSGHVPLEVQGDIRRNKEDMKDRGIVEGGRQYCVVFAADLAVAS